MAQLVVAPTVVLLVPIAPAPTGNGLAMRAGMLLDALAGVAAVHLVVVPVSGPADDCSWAAARARSVTVVRPVTAASARVHLTGQLADPALRDRLGRTSPLPARVTLAPPTLAPEVVAALTGGIGSPDAVVAMRIYLAPLGITLAQLLGAGRVVVDADDDDAALLHHLGERDEAAAFERLARCWLPDADAVLAASALEAGSLATRAGLDTVGVVPNAIAVPSGVPPAPGVGRLLFVGNLTYGPNAAAARLLADEILPMVRTRHPGATLDIVGPHDARLARLSETPGVRIPGRVPEVGPYYAGADVVVVPLRHGAGTRIKVLEAFAHRRPVVATPAAVAGLEVQPGRELMVAEAADDLVGAIGDLLDDPPRAAALVEAAADLVVARYCPAVVAPLVRAAILGPDNHELPGGTVSA